MNPGRFDADRLLTVLDEDRVERLFTLALVAYVGVLMWLTLGYDEFARVIPLIVGIPTLAFLVILLLGQVSSRVDEVLHRYRLQDVLGIEGEVDRLDGTVETDDGSTLYERRIRFLTIAGWILGLTLLFAYVGIVEAITLFLLGYYRYSANQNVLRSVAYTVGVLVFIYLVFDLILEMRLFTESLFSPLLP